MVTMVTPPSCRCCRRGWGWHPQSTQSSSLSRWGLWGWLGPWSRSLGPISSCGLEFDGEGSNAQLLASLVYILGSQYGSVWRRLISVSLHLHPTSYMADGFLAREISDVHTSVIEGCKGVAHTKYIFSFIHLRAKADDLFFLFSFPLRGAISARLLQTPPPEREAEKLFIAEKPWQLPFALPIAKQKGLVTLKKG